MYIIRKQTYGVKFSQNGPLFLVLWLFISLSHVMYDDHFSSLLLGSIRNNDYEVSWHSPVTWKVVQIVTALLFVEIESKDSTFLLGRALNMAAVREPASKWASILRGVYRIMKVQQGKLVFAFNTTSFQRWDSIEEQVCFLLPAEWCHQQAKPTLPSCSGG